MLVGLESIPTIIMTCFILHNFLTLDKCSTIDPQMVARQLAANQAEEAKYINKPDPIFTHNSHAGEEARKTLIEFVALSINEPSDRPTNGPSR